MKYNPIITNPKQEISNICRYFCWFFYVVLASKYFCYRAGDYNPANDGRYTFFHCLYGAFGVGISGNTHLYSDSK